MIVLRGELRKDITSLTIKLYTSCHCQSVANANLLTFSAYNVIAHIFRNIRDITTISYKIFETNSKFHVKWRTTGKV